MAKKKKKKEEEIELEEQDRTLLNRVFGLIFIVLAILGIGLGKPFGLIGKLVRMVGIILFGKLNIIFIILNPESIVGSFTIFQKPGQYLFREKSSIR